MGKVAYDFLCRGLSQQRETIGNKAKFVLTKKCRKSIVTPRNLVIRGSLSVFSTFRKNLKS